MQVRQKKTIPNLPLDFLSTLGAGSPFYFMKKKILKYWVLKFLKSLYFAHIFVISVSKPGNHVKNLFFTSSISCCSRGI